MHETSYYNGLFTFLNVFSVNDKQTMAFAKDSPILEPLMQTINEMDKSGILKKIHKNYEKVYDFQCEERKVGT